MLKLCDYILCFKGYYEMKRHSEICYFATNKYDLQLENHLFLRKNSQRLFKIVVGRNYDIVTIYNNKFNKQLTSGWLFQKTN